MPDEYIRKLDAIDLINKISNLDQKAKGGICVSLANLQKADVVPVVHGEWIPQDHNKRIGCATTALFYYPKCSACGNNGNYDMNFCPNCGAKMDVR